MNEKGLQEVYVTNLKRLRKEKRMSQVELAEKTGMSSKFISYIESGREWGSFKTLVMISEALGVEPYQLLKPQTNVPSEKDVKLRGLLSMMMDILKEV